MFLPLEYINYRWNAKGRHGIHSPFVYDFVNNCLRTQLNASDLKRLNPLFEKLKNGDQEIEIQDFGAGSKKLGSKRKVADIFKTSSSHGKYGELLYRLAKHYEPKEILEFGTSLGVGTAYLALGAPNSNITTVEACPNTRAAALTNFSALNNIDSQLSTFNDYLDRLPKDKRFDLIFIDGHHDGHALLGYLQRLQQHSHTKTMFILDDIRWSDPMKSAWNAIVADSRFHLTMDLFRVGIVMRLEDQEKEHFVVKY